ncbi:MAG: fibronectin type III domain-containing protein [Spirochaetaceae bacterium]|jgi:hypothetical protein|nr:fibronectin type III domain-containing protein [Spirochaetaceae bacterium]
MRNGWRHGELVREFAVLLALVFAGCKGISLPVPTAPGDIKLLVKSASTITVSWSAVTGATDYEIAYGTQADALTNTLPVASSDTVSSGNNRSVDITDLTANTTYYVLVRAGNSGGWSEASETKSAKTPPVGGGDSGDELSIPQIAEAVANSPERVDLSWETVLADFYYLYRAEGADTPEGYTLIGTPREASYTDLTVKPGTTYYYQISAISGNKESDKSEVKSITTPARPEESVVPETGLSNALKWLKSNAKTDGVYTIELTGDETLLPVELSYTNQTNITITIKGSGENRTIILNGTDSIFKVTSGVTLVLGSGITIKGDPTTESNTKALIQVLQGGKLVMQEGAKITENMVNFFNSQGGGIYVSGTFIMEGGEISGNIVTTNNRSAYGGGVYVYKDATFIMNGGKISRNTVKSSAYSPFGGGVYIGDAATFVMNGGEISGNTVESGASYVAYGGGVSVDGIFTLNNGKISGNTASAIKSSAYGGGVYTASAFIMKNGEISDNKVSTTAAKYISGGGGVYSAGSLLISGGMVSGNTASSTISAAYGGGVFLAKDTILILEGGEISNNIVSSSSSEILYGGGIYAEGEISMIGGKVNGNTLSSAKTSAYGGGILAIGDFIMYGGEISANILNTPQTSLENISCGAGVFVYGSFTMEGGEIKNNKAADSIAVIAGGGVFVNDSGKFIMNDGTMSGNVANYGGGIYIYSMGVLKKSSFGGIIYGSDDSANGNVAVNGDGFGHVAYVYTDDSPDNIKYRDITADVSVGLDTDDAALSGGWQ